jgi:hypothetical protein
MWYDIVIWYCDINTRISSKWMIILLIHLLFFIYSSVSSISILLIWLIVFLIWLIVFLIWLIVFLARFTHSIVSRLIRLISMIVFNAENDLIFVIESAELLLSWIHFISIISRFSYDCLRITTFIINRFSTVISSRTRQSYENLLSMTSIRKMKMLSIFVKIAFSIESTSK